jgi:Skp family chaperone for outer membrane proteins
MKKIILLILMCGGIAFSAIAQDDPKDAGRLQAYKIAFLTKKMNLTPEEAQRFWPIYNKYEAELRTARREDRKNKASEIVTEEKILNIRKKYNGEFSKALSTEKVNTLFKSEKEFGNIVQKEFLERRNQRPNNIKRNRE